MSAHACHEGDAPKMPRTVAEARERSERARARSREATAPGAQRYWAAHGSLALADGFYLTGDIAEALQVIDVPLEGLRRARGLGVVG